MARCRMARCRLSGRIDRRAPTSVTSRGLDGALADTSVFIANENGRVIDASLMPDRLAATALAHALAVVTQDDDLPEVGGLRIIRV